MLLYYFGFLPMPRRRMNQFCWKMREVCFKADVNDLNDHSTAGRKGGVLVSGSACKGLPVVSFELFDIVIQRVLTPKKDETKRSRMPRGVQW